MKLRIAIAFASLIALSVTAHDVRAEAPPTPESIIAPATQNSEAKPAGISVQDAYSFATSPTQPNGAVFLTIVNASTGPDKLVSAAVDFAGAVELHTNMVEENSIAMIKVSGYDVPAGETLVLEPKGHHIMLIGLKEPLKAGQTFPVKLVFEKAGEQSVSVTVRPAGDTGEALKQHHHTHQH